jgi:hypothetical protein
MSYLFTIQITRQYEYIALLLEMHIFKFFPYNHPTTRWITHYSYRPVVRNLYLSLLWNVFTT